MSYTNPVSVWVVKKEVCNYGDDLDLGTRGTFVAVSRGKNEIDPNTVRSTDNVFGAPFTQPELVLPHVEDRFNNLGIIASRAMLQIPRLVAVSGSKPQ